LPRRYRGRTGITEVCIPASVRSIGPHAFKGCTGINTLRLAEGLESIGAGAFEGCTGIVSLRFPESLRSIQNSAFASCTGITSLCIPQRVHSVGTWAFRHCRGITDLDLQEGPQPTADLNVEEEEEGLGSNGACYKTPQEGLRSIGLGAFFMCTGQQRAVNHEAGVGEFS